jgi:hypothetical protein
MERAVLRCLKSTQGVRMSLLCTKIIFARIHTGSSASSRGVCIKPPFSRSHLLLLYHPYSFFFLPKNKSLTTYVFALQNGQGQGGCWELCAVSLKRLETWACLCSASRVLMLLLQMRSNGHGLLGMELVLCLKNLFQKRTRHRR